MRRSIATVSLSGTLSDKLLAIAAAGFDGIELFEPDFTQARLSAAELHQHCQDLGLRIELLQPFRDFEGMPRESFERSLVRAERKFDLMQALGCDLMLVCSNTSAPALPEPQLAADQLRALAERAAHRQLRIGFEALAWGRHVSKWRQAWDIVQRAEHPNLGLIVDSFHTASLQDSPSGIAGVGAKLFFVQMADAPILGMNVIDWARHHRNFPGQGQFNVVGFFEQCLLAGYTGPLSLEIFNDVFRATPNRRIAVDAMRSLLWLESQVRARLGTTPPSGGPAARPEAAVLRAPLQAAPLAAAPLAAAPLAAVPLDVAPLAAASLTAVPLVAAPLVASLFEAPPAPVFNGISFVEFAVDGAHAEALGDLLRQLGFHFAGRHRSKAVTLFRQGGINIVLNQQATAAARERFAQQGACVCALGLRTDDPAAAFNRAVALKSAPYEAPTGVGEQRLPSVRAPGGLALHFVADSLGENGLFEKDFLLESDLRPKSDLLPRASNACLRTVDHLGIGLAYDRLDTWVLFCRAVLGLDAAEAVKVPDPFGMIRSNGMADAGRQLRLVLNVSLSERTRMAKAAQASGGVGVQYLALASGDLLANVEQLRRAGLRFVPISANYYDDLLTRFELDASLVARLRAANLLFDRGASGDYLHAYVEGYAGAGFFFELVQRVGAYDGYGAVNAPVRMASQAQEDVR